MAKRHAEDHVRYQQLLEQTRDSEGVEHRDQAVKLLTGELAKKVDRTLEFAEARAVAVADDFDNSHSPETEDGQMRLNLGTYLALGNTGRVRVDQATAVHTRLWLDVQTLNKVRQDQAYGAKFTHGLQLLHIQEEHECSMWVADLIHRGIDPENKPDDGDLN
jgi:hypothetical protein